MLKGKKIVLGITGSIAAYKACYIIRGLVKAGAEVQVVITPAGKVKLMSCWVCSGAMKVRERWSTC